MINRELQNKRKGRWNCSQTAVSMGTAVEIVREGQKTVTLVSSKLAAGTTGSKLAAETSSKLAAVTDSEH